MLYVIAVHPDSKVHGANMGPIWDRQDPGGPHAGPVNFVIWGILSDIYNNIDYISMVTAQTFRMGFL